MGQNAMQTDRKIALYPYVSRRKKRRPSCVFQDRRRGKIHIFAEEMDQPTVSVGRLKSTWKAGFFSR